MPPKYVFNYVALFDEETEEWKVYHKLDKRIPKTVECYGNGWIRKSKSLEIAIEKPENLGEVEMNSLGSSDLNPSKFDIQVIQNV